MSGEPFAVLLSFWLVVLVLADGWRWGRTKRRIERLEAQVAALLAAKEKP